MSEFESPLVDERVGRIALACATEPSDLETTRLVARVGAAEAVRLATGTGSVPGMNPASREKWRSHLGPRLTMQATERALEATTANKLRVLIPSDKDWPTGLSDLAEHAPLVLWAQGDTDLFLAPVIQRMALIGSRASTTYGNDVARGLAIDLAIVGRQVVNGGAYGIDAHALRGALAGNGKPIAIMPSGPDRLYPAGNRELLERVAETGALLSELPPGSAPTKWRFEQRDRLVAAIAGATVVVEAAGHSSTLRTAADARALGRQVGAVPGSVTTASSTGTHRLIREQIATLVTHIHDIQDLLTGRERAAERELRSAIPAVRSPRDTQTR